MIEEFRSLMQSRWPSRRERPSSRATAGPAGESLEAKKLRQIIDEERTKNPPKVAVIGKAGVGKTTTINNLFDANFVVSHSTTGTRSAQVKDFVLEGGGTLRIVDMPGLGEGLKEDAAFEPIYVKELPAVDVALYVLQADERFLAEDQRILAEVVLPAMCRSSNRQGLREAAGRLVVGLNKVDLMRPGAWDTRINYPTKEQESTIERRCKAIVQALGRTLPDLSAEKIVYYSADRRYRLPDLLLQVVSSAGDAAWKLPSRARDPWELAEDPDARAYAKEREQAYKKKHRGKQFKEG